MSSRFKALFDFSYKAKPEPIKGYTEFVSKGVSFQV